MTTARRLETPVPTGVAALPPNIFAIVMATGIVSLAAHAAGQPAIAVALFAVNVAAFATLVILVALRCVRHPDRVRADLGDHAKAPGFFTLVAATGVFGGQCVTLVGLRGVGLGLWVAALVVWLALTYGVLPRLMTTDPKPPFETAINGGWLLVVVGTQSLCVLGCLAGGESVLVAALGFHLVGGMLYVWLIGLIAYRLLFLPLAPADVTPPYWIAMGAVAISTLAGASLTQRADALPLLTELAPALKLTTLLFWATATWWIPLLVALGVWRHLLRRVLLRYDHAYWAAVFPLGMYSACTQKLALTADLPILVGFGGAFAWVALAAWGVTAVGLTRHLIGAGRTAP